MKTNMIKTILIVLFVFFHISGSGQNSSNVSENELTKGIGIILSDLTILADKPKLKDSPAYLKKIDISCCHCQPNYNQNNKLTFWEKIVYFFERLF